MPPIPGRRIFLLATTFFLGGLLLLNLIGESHSPLFLGGEYKLENQPIDSISIPFRKFAFSTEPQTATYTIRFFLPHSAPSLFHFSFTGCLEKLYVNESPAYGDTLPLCYNGIGHTFDIGRLLHEGANVFLLSVLYEPEVITHSITIKASLQDPLVLVPTLMSLALILWYFTTILTLWKPQRKTKCLALIFFVGMVLRFLYFTSTSYSERAYDWNGHLHYIDFILQHWSIPPAQLGWESFHPPLYYLLSAIWAKMGLLLGRAPQFLLEDLQGGSFLLSLGTLATILWIGTMLFPQKEQERNLLLFSALLSTFPGLILFASPITNDVLIHFISFLFLALFIRWWKQKKWIDWMLLSAVLGLGMLTKNTTLVLLLFALSSLWLPSSSMNLKQKIVAMGSCLGIIALLAGWLLFLRFAIEGETHFVGNITKTSPAALFAVSPSHFFTIHLPRLLSHPFIRNIGPPEDTFWEYLFLSAYSGGFAFSQPLLLSLSAFMIYTGLGLMLLALRGWIRSLQKPHTPFPLGLLLLCLLLTHTAFTLSFPSSSSQNFRFSILALVPITFSIVRGTEHLQPPISDGVLALLLLHIGLPILFFSSLFFLS